MGEFGGKMEEGVVRCLPSTNSFFTFRVFYVFANFSEHSSRNASMRVDTEGHMDREKLVL